MGHDVRLVTYAKEYVRGKLELTSEQLEYARESGKLDRARTQVEKEDARTRRVETTKAACKAERKQR